MKIFLLISAGFAGGAIIAFGYASWLMSIGHYDIAQKIMLQSVVMSMVSTALSLIITIMARRK